MTAVALFFVLALGVVVGMLFLLVEGRRTVSLCAGYLGITMALSGIMLLGGGVFAAILLFILSMSTAVALLLYGLRVQGRGREGLDLPQPARLTGKLLGSGAVLASLKGSEPRLVARRAHYPEVGGFVADGISGCDREQQEKKLY